MRASPVYRALRPPPARASWCTPCSSAATSKGKADVPAVVELLRRAHGSDQQHEELCSLLTSAPFTASHLLQVIRLLPDTDAALRFFDWCRSQGSVLSAASALHGPSAYQAIFERAAQQPGPRPPCARLKDLLVRSTEQGYSLTFDSAVILVRAFGKAGMLADVLRVVRSLKPSLRRASLCNDVLRLLFDANDPHYRAEAVVLLREMMHSPHPRCRADSHSGSIVYSTLLRRNQLIDEEITSLLVEMAEHKIFPSGDAQCSHIINKLCCSRQAEVAWNFLHAVKSAGGIVGAPPWISLLSDLSREGDIERMNILFSEMEQMGHHRNVITLGIVINNLCKSHRIDEALKVLENMTDQTSNSVVVPDVVIFNTVIDGLCKVGRLQESLALLERMKKEYGCTPNTVTYNSLIDGFCKAGDINRGQELLAQMNDEEISPNAATMNALINGMCRQGRIGSALEFFRGLQLDADINVEGNAVTYSILIGAFFHVNNVNKAREMFEEMLNSGLRPDAITYFTMISGLTLAGNLDEALCVASDMEKNGFMLDTKSYNTLIAGFCRKKQLDRAHNLLDEMVKKGLEPDEITFNTIIVALCKIKDFRSANLLVKKMLEKGKKPNAITYGALIHGYCKADDINTAMDIFRSMDAVGVQPTSMVYNILIDYVSKKKKPFNALSLMNEMKGRGLLPTIVTFNALFRTLKEHHMVSEAYKLMDMMKEQKLHPDYITVEVLSNWLPAVGEVAKLKSFMQEVN